MELSGGAAPNASRFPYVKCNQNIYELKFQVEALGNTKMQLYSDSLLKMQPKYLRIELEVEVHSNTKLQRKFKFHTENAAKIFSS
jgi:hypothetical protein